MKNYFRKSLFIAALLSMGMIFGQTIDPKSKTILDDLTNNYKSKKNSYFKFTYTSGSSTQTGIFYSDNAKYRLKIMGTEQLFDGSKIYNINEDDKEITIAKPSENQVAFSPLSYLDSYKKDYNVRYAGKKVLNGIPVDVIKMTPAKPNGLKQVMLYVNRPQKKLVKIEQVSKNDDLAVIKIMNYKENQNLPTSLFTFDKSKYQNYLITEL